MKLPIEILETFKDNTLLVDKEIQKILKNQERMDLYRMMSYFFGFVDKDFKKNNEYGGKRFRSAICLLLSDFYGVGKESLAAATSIEIFHNFTLIHDDIEDRDPIRRGRPSLWKVWGVNHGINTGDAQLILAYQSLTDALKENDTYKAVIDYLNGKYLQVAEGQFLDLNLAESSTTAKDVSEKKYSKMIEKKSGVLVGASAYVAGIIAKKSKSECEALWEYGLNLGLAYQLNDDLISIWGREQETGKVTEKDIVERKKTLPIIYAFLKLPQKDKNQFRKIFDQSKKLTRSEVLEIKKMLSKTDAQQFVSRLAQKHLKKSFNAIQKLSITKEEKMILTKINKMLVPEIKQEVK